MKNNYVHIFLDDTRLPTQAVLDKANATTGLVLDKNEVKLVLAKNYLEFERLIRKHNSSVLSIWFDHDLREQQTGYDAVKFLSTLNTNSLRSLKFVVLHSGNPVGVHNMKSYLELLREKKFTNKKWDIYVQSLQPKVDFTI